MIEEIKAVFRHVGRGHGVSWSESVVIDNYGTPEERRAARSLDTERFWSELIDDPRWEPFPGIGGFSFLDPNGFRYYLPPVMIRTIRGGDEGIEFFLTVPEPGEDLRAHFIAQLSSLNDDQRRCVARFVRYMMDLHKEKAASPEPDATIHDLFFEGWERTFRSFWHQYLERAD